MIKFFLIIFFLVNLSTNILAESNYDQWQETDKSYKDLINEGFEIQGYDTTVIKSDNGFTILLFVTALQKSEEVFECQEYQTLDLNMETISMSLICKKLIQPYKKGIGT